MATERRYLKGDVVEILPEFKFSDAMTIPQHGPNFYVGGQLLHNGVVCGVEQYQSVHTKFYAHQVKLLKRPWWNWLRLPFVKKVKVYQRSTVK